MSICSGIGTLDHGVRRAIPNSRVVCHLEREAFACAVLAKKMGEGLLDEAPVWLDIATFDGLPWRGVVDLIVAGLPCQPFSLAGKQKGFEDQRASGVWPHFFRIIEEVRPSLVFLENVPGLLKFFRPIGEKLCAMGFEIEAGIFSAAEVGAPHLRQRVFILGATDAGKQLLADAGSAEWRPGLSGDSGENTLHQGRTEGTDGIAQRGENVAEPEGGGLGILWEPSERGGQPDGSVEAVGDTESDRGRRGVNGTEEGVRPTEERWRGSPESGGTVAGSTVEGFQVGRGERKGMGGELETSQRGGNSLADTDRTGGAQCWYDGRMGRERESLPFWPPGPSEHERWAEILRDWPELAPAVEHAKGGGAGEHESEQERGTAEIAERGYAPVEHTKRE